ncbi:MAG: branched-chain amino acid ABC transporter permease [Nanoarchaeota archaeon]|nr:branched-chain amino acid ABC transporter permease [Nanoarchaeota archaeon]
MLESYLIHVLILIGIYCILAVSLNFAIGYGGLLNLGHIAFFGIGAYSSTLLTIGGIPFLFALILSCIIASLCGWFLSLMTNKLKDDYLALATFGFGLVVYSLMQNLTRLTKGPLGISGIPKAEILGLTINNSCYLILTIAMLIIAYLVMTGLVNSKFGRLMGGIRDNELLMKILSRNTQRIKGKILSLSAFFAGMAGSLYAHYIGFIDPSTFGIKEIMLLLTIVLLGGLASLKGTIITTFLLVSIPEILRFVPIPDNILGPAQTAIYALVLLLILRYRPRGILGKIDLN